MTNIDGNDHDNHRDDRFSEVKGSLDSLVEKQLEHITQLKQKNLVKALLLYSALPLIVATGLFFYFTHAHWSVILLAAFAAINVLGVLFFKCIALPKLIKAEKELKRSLNETV